MKSFAACLMEKKTWPLLLAALLLFGLGSRFALIAEPAQVAFDESLIGSFASHYFDGTRYFDIHPPHMKLAYAAAAKLGGFKGAFPAFEKPYDGSYYLWCRALACLLGGLCPFILASTLRASGAGSAASFAAGFAMACEGAFFADSRFMLNDGPLLFFGLLCWLCYAKAVRGPKGMGMGWAAGCALALAAASSVKWTGLGFAAPLAIHAAWRIAKGRRGDLRLALMIAAALPVWHLAGYAIHFQLLDKPGPGDAYMGPQFNAWAAGRPAPNYGFLDASLDLTRAMGAYAANVGPHPYSSRWSGWPAGERGIFMWHQDGSKGRPASRIYMVPNLASWWASTAAICAAWIGLAFAWLRFEAAKAPWPAWAPRALLAVGSHLGLWLPYAFIGRPMFIYHYFPAFCSGLAAAAFLIDAMPEKPRLWCAAAWAASCLAMFAWMLPVWAGWELREAAFAARMLLPQWP